MQLEHLPTSDEQDWLSDHLAELIRSRGADRFLTAPIVEPTAAFFPESRGAASYVLDRATRRLLQYAGLGHLDVSFSLFRPPSPQDPPSDEPSCNSVAALFAGIENDCCHFGLNVMNPVDAEHLAGVMCHEVAHAYRAEHGLVRNEPAEELLTDLTTIYLGFGILAANNSYRYRTAGDAHVMQWSMTRSGYLPPQALTYLLAVQVGLRSIDPHRRRRLVEHLEPNQAAFFKSALKVIARDPDRIRTRLGLSAVGRWTDMERTEGILHDLPPFVPWSRELIEQVQERPVNEGRAVFLVRQSRLGLFMVLGAMISFIPAAFLIDRTGSTIAGFLLVFAGTAASAVIGSRQAWDVCSDVDCRTPLPAGLSKCPSCGGTIEGRIRDFNDRLDAEDWLEEERSGEHKP